MGVLYGVFQYRFSFYFVLYLTWHYWMHFPSAHICLTSCVFWQCPLLPLETRHLFYDVIQVCLSSSILTGAALPLPFISQEHGYLGCWEPISSPRMLEEPCVSLHVSEVCPDLSLVHSLSWSHISAFFSVTSAAWFSMCCISLTCPIPKLWTRASFSKLS